MIPNKIPTIDELGLPAAAQRDRRASGTASCSSPGPPAPASRRPSPPSSSKINREKAIHIITIEDPIEYLHPHDKATINQREVGTDTQTFALALRAALRQAPKVILVGEMRDVETISIALEASETGHLVLSTLHTIDAAKTIDRIVGVFPKNEERQIRTRFSQSFKWIVSQRLVPKIGRRPHRRSARSCAPTRARGSTCRRASARARASPTPWRTALSTACRPSTASSSGSSTRAIVDREVALSYATNRTNLQLRLDTQGGAAKAEAIPSSRGRRDGASGAPAAAAGRARRPAPRRDIATISWTT